MKTLRVTKTLIQLNQRQKSTLLTDRPLLLTRHGTKRFGLVGLFPLSRRQENKDSQLRTLEVWPKKTRSNIKSRKLKKFTTSKKRKMFFTRVWLPLSGHTQDLYALKFFSVQLIWANHTFSKKSWLYLSQRNRTKRSTWRSSNGQSSWFLQDSSNIWSMSMTFITT